MRNNKILETPWTALKEENRPRRTIPRWWRESIPFYLQRKTETSILLFILALRKNQPGRTTWNGLANWIWLLPKCLQSTPTLLLLKVSCWHSRCGMTTCWRCFIRLDQQSMGLYPALYLSKGSKVMLKRNLWTNVELVNGVWVTFGTYIWDTIYAPATSPVDSHPMVIMVELDS